MTIGLDYSLSSPSCCIGDSDDIRDCFVFCYAQTKKMLPLADFIKMKYYPEWQSAEERHYKLAKDIDVPQTRISEIIKEKRRITADTAIRLSNYFGNSAKFWLGLQDDYDIEFEKAQKEIEFKNIIPFDDKKVA